MGRLNGPTDHPTERPTERPTEKPPSTTRPGINIRNRFKKSHRIELRELHTQLEKLHASHLGTCIMAVKRRPEIATPCGQYSEFAATYRCLSNCSIPLTQSATAVFRFEAEPEGAQIPPPPPVSPWSPFFLSARTFFSISGRCAFRAGPAFPRVAVDERARQRAPARWRHHGARPRAAAAPTRRPRPRRACRARRRRARGARHGRSPSRRWVASSSRLRRCNEARHPFPGGVRRSRNRCRPVRSPTAPAGAARRGSLTRDLAQRIGQGE